MKIIDIGKSFRLCAQRDVPDQAVNLLINQHRMVFAELSRDGDWSKLNNCIDRIELRGNLPVDKNQDLTIGYARRMNGGESPDAFGLIQAAMVEVPTLKGNKIVTQTEPRLYRMFSRKDGNGRLALTLQSFILHTKASEPLVRELLALEQHTPGLISNCIDNLVRVSRAVTDAAKANTHPPNSGSPPTTPLEWGGIRYHASENHVYLLEPHYVGKTGWQTAYYQP